MKYYDPEGYAEEQDELRQCYETNKRYHLKKVYKKICPVCGDIFYATNNLQIYDSESCKCKAHRRRKKTDNICKCLVCGNYFTPIRQDAKYCSDKCRQKAYRYRKTTRQRCRVDYP